MESPGAIPAAVAIGRRRFAPAYTQADGRTSLPLEFAPCGSWFIIFREPSEDHPATAKSNTARYSTLSQLEGPWQVTFDTAWGGPGTVEFADLTSWTERDELGIKFYSGTAVYRKSFELPDDAPLPAEEYRVWLDLGSLRELAEVKVNGRPCGIVWSPPFQVDISDAVKPGANQVEIEVVNFWPNRIIGDDGLPPQQRLTRTNIRKLTKETELMESGLFGPVTLQQSRRIVAPHDPR